MQTPETLEEVAQFAGETYSAHYAWFAHPRNKEEQKLWVSKNYDEIKQMSIEKGIRNINWNELFDIVVKSAVNFELQLE